MDNHTFNSAGHEDQSGVRMLVCDGSALVRAEAVRLLSGHPVIETIETARNLREAVEKTATLRPDVVVIDVESPTFGGPQAAAEIVRAGTTSMSDGPIVVASCRESSAGAHTGLRALAEGASDVIVLNAERLSKEPDACRDELLRAVANMHNDRRADRGAARGRGRPIEAIGPARATMIAIGAGEGGTIALERLMALLSAGLPCPIVIAQRMSACFTRALAERLDGCSAVSVVHGESGMPLHPGVAYVVPGGRIGRVRSLGPGPARLELGLGGDTRPAADELFCSCARHARAGCTAIVLSGSGEDGARGGREIASLGGILLTQSVDESVCVGMPIAARRAGATEASLDRMGAYLAAMGVELARAA